MALGLASTANLVTGSSTALQDIAELTGAKTQQQNRWMARLVEIPLGADFVASGSEKGAAPTDVSLTMAVKTAESVQVLDHNLVLESGKKASINRALKGDRVVQPKKQGLSIAGIQSLTGAAPLVTGSINQTDSHALLAAAGSFRSSLPAVFSPSVSVAAATATALARTQPAPTGRLVLASVDLQDFETTARGRVPLSTNQMKQARAVAKMMNKALVLAKKRREKAESLAEMPDVTTAYAPGMSSQETAMASAFAAVLRPSLRKSKDGVVKIRLAKGDHKWADDPLPKRSYSKAERRCLANGVYFEARGEPKLGQKAVAQVILNRVRNPAYPNTICGVVYQNKRKRNACQFSFACDGIRDRVNSMKHWRMATTVANDAIDGRFWLRSVGSSSHYHADYVWPKWRRKMRKMTKIGRHIFYRTFGGGWS
ncbi:MAG: cell wall hydrolase [Rhizobiaceae bacterium]